MNSTEIENERVEKLKKINSTREHLNIICSEVHDLEKRLVDLKEAKRQARHVLAVLNTDAEILQSEYWRSKNG